MEELMPILIFLVFAGLSIAGRAMKGQERRQRENPPQWPPQEMPGPGERTRTQPPPPAPSRQPRPQQWPQAPQPVQPRSQQPQSQRRESVQVGVGPTSGSMGTGRMEGVSSMEGHSMMAEGPSARERAQEVKQRSVHGQQAAAGGSALGELLNDRDVVAQGIILAEVLGKPKALRGPGRR